MEVAGLICALIGVCSEEVALGLGEVGRETGPPVLVKVAKGRREGRAGNASSNAQGNHTTPCGLSGVHLFGELWVHEEVGKAGVAVICALDAIEELQKGEEEAKAEEGK